MSKDLRFTREENNGSVRLKLFGELDIYTSQELKKDLYGIADANGTDLVIDCEGLNYIDSTGLGIFVGALKKAKKRDKRMVVTGLKDNIKKLFIITGLDKVFIIE